MSPPGSHAPPRRTAPSRRGFYAFACVAAGIVTADLLPSVHPALWFATACIILIVAAVGPRSAARLSLAACVALLGAGSMSARVLWAPADRLSLAGDVEVLPVRGVAVSSPRPVPRADVWETTESPPPPRLRFTVALQAVQSAGAWQAASGDVEVFVPAHTLAPRAGDSLEIVGRFRPVQGPSNPGQRDPRRWAAQENRVGDLSVVSAEGICSFAGRAPMLSRLRAAINESIGTLRDRASTALDLSLGPAADDGNGQAAALLRAMLIGGEDPGLRPVSDDMSRLGIVHILSISGFHLVLVASVVGFLIRLTGDRGVWEHALAAAAIGLYLLILPAQAPVVRSGIMVLALLLTEACGRRYDRLNILAWTACALALWRPLDIYSPGFQLSFGVTAVLIWRAAAWNQSFADSGVLWMPGVKGAARRAPETLLSWTREHLLGLCTATALAFCISTPAVAWHVGVLSILGVAAGVVLTLPSIAAIATGFVATLVALAWPVAASPIAQAALFFSDLTVRGSHLAAQFPGAALDLPRVPLAWAIATTAVTVAAVAPGGWKRAGTRIAAFACAGWFAALLLCAGWPIASPTLDRFALPRSSATLVRAADQGVLIDPGSAARLSGAYTLRRAVRACGAWRIRTVIITGPQLERFDHLPELARPLGVQTVLLPPGFERLAAARPDGDAARLLRRLREAGVATRSLDAAESLTVGDVSIAVRAPGVVTIGRTGAAPRTVALPPLQQAERLAISGP